MNQGIPARDTMVDRNGQITSIWLIFFERLYSVYDSSNQTNAESIAQIKQIANEALKIAKQSKDTNDTQQKRIDELHKRITDSINNYATSQDVSNLNKRFEQIEFDLETQQQALDKLQKSLNELQKSTGDSLQNLQIQINKLAKSNFLDAPEDGKIYGRKDANWSEIVQVNLFLPFFLSNGTQQNLALTSDFQLPFFLADGTQQNIQMVTV